MVFDQVDATARLKETRLCDKEGKIPRVWLGKERATGTSLKDCDRASHRARPP